MSKASSWQWDLPAILSEQLGARNGAIAGDVWEDKYAHQAGPNVIAFMREVSEQLNFDARQRNALRTAIRRAREGKPDIATPQSSAGVLVAVALLGDIRAQLTARTSRPSADFITELGRQLANTRSGLPELAGPALGWLVQGGAMPPMSFAQLTKLVHGVYVALCRSLGPVIADEMLKRAVAVAGATPEAEHYPPSKLLYPDAL